MLRGAFCWHGLCPLIVLEETATAYQYKVALSDNFYPLMEHFQPDASGLFQDDSASIHWALGVTGWFDEYEDYVNQVLGPSQALNLNPIEQLSSSVLDSTIRQF